MANYILKDDAEQFICEVCELPSCPRLYGNDCEVLCRLNKIPAADVVSWEWLEQYVDYFCAEASMPEFVRKAKIFYKSTNEAMQGGVIDG